MVDVCHTHVSKWKALILFEWCGPPLPMVKSLCQRWCLKRWVILFVLVHEWSAVELLMNIFFFLFFFLFSILEIDTNSFKNLLCPPVYVFINFDSYSFDFHLFLLLMHFDLQLFCNFIYKNFISFNFYIKLLPYFFVFILF
jgi:hypothetical protein